MHSVSLRRFRAIGTTAIVVLMAAFTWRMAKEIVESDTKDDGFFGGGKRKLLPKEDKCSIGGLSDPLNLTHPVSGILYFIGMMWTFVSMGQVCEDYFVSALNAMVMAWNISPDMAGAIFMAAGTSMPEVFAALLGLFSANGSDTGINTVVGSTVFNMVCIIGGSIIIYPGPGTIELPLISLLRDNLFFAAAVVLLYFSFRDTQVGLTDCLPLLAAYCCYVISCSATPMIEEYIASFFHKEKLSSKPSFEDQLEKPLLRPETSPARTTYDIKRPDIYPLKQRRSLPNLRSVYGSIPHQKNVAQVNHNNYDLMLKSRASIVSALFGLPEKDGEHEIPVIKPLHDVANTVGLNQLLAIEQLFFDGSLLLHQTSGGGSLHLVGDSHPVKKITLMKDLMKHSPGISPEDSQWDDLVEVLNFYDLETISKIDFIPVYKTWYQCSRVLRMPMKIMPMDVHLVSSIFHRVVGSPANFMEDEQVKSIVNQLPLSDVQRLELHQLLQSETGEPGVYLTRSGYKTLFLQWVAYSRSLLDEHVCLASPATIQRSVRSDSFTTEKGEQRGGEDEIPIHTVLNVPKGYFQRVCFIIGLPMSIFLSLSVPDCRKPYLKNWFLLPMIVSMLWLVILVYLMLNWAQKWGCLWGVNPSLMGITGAINGYGMHLESYLKIVHVCHIFSMYLYTTRSFSVLPVTAAGTSLPDLLASLAVARAGEGQMSVTNAFGSNIFGIGLGVPFAVKAVVSGEPVYMPAESLLTSTIFLIGLQAAFVLIVSLYKLRMPTVFGYGLILSYVVFIAYQIINLN